MGRNSYKNKHRGGRNHGHNFRNSKGNDFHKPKNIDSSNKKETAPQDKNRNEQPIYAEKVTLKENQVGITEFVSTGKGFTGVFKARYSDFHVNEIDLNDTVLEINDWTVPQSTEPDNSVTNKEIETAKGQIADVVTEAMWEEIHEIAKTERTTPLEIEVTDLDKEKRTIIHKLVKKLYENECTSVTFNKNSGETKFIRVVKLDKKTNRRGQWIYPGDFVHFLLYKENMDTSEVAVMLSNALRLKPSQINYSGTKDKRGKTTQRFCVKKRHPAQIAKAFQRIPSVKVGNFTFHESILKLGDLKGNRFRVALRHVEEDQAEIEKSLQSAKQYGFINYYGLQRFGNNASVPTYQVGIALLKSDFKMACELILKPRDNDIPFMRNIRETWWKDRDSAAAAAMFHGDRFIEKKLLDGLAEYGENDYANSLRKIPRNMLLMYTHAYQSMIFNRIASRRIKEHGLKLIVGDLVYRDQEELDDIALDTENALIQADQDLEDNLEGAKGKELKTDFKQKVKPLTEEDIASEKYTILDVVLPLPGYDITYPSNEVGKWYDEILAEEGLTSEKLKHGVKTFSLTGAYRKLLVQPQNMSWYFKKYNSPEEDIIPSHFEKAVVNKEGDSGKFTALVLDFCLPASTYATMFLREILKSDTSSTSQAQIGRDEMKKFEEKNRAEDKDANGHEAAALEVQKEKVNDADDKTADKRPIDESEHESAPLEGQEEKVNDASVAEKRTIEKEEEPDVKRLKTDTE